MVRPPVKMQALDLDICNLPEEESLPTLSGKAEPNLSLSFQALALSPGNSSYTVCRDTASTVVGVNRFHGPECSRARS